MQFTLKFSTPDLLYDRGVISGVHLEDFLAVWAGDVAHGLHLRLRYLNIANLYSMACIGFNPIKETPVQVQRFSFRRPGALNLSGNFRIDLTNGRTRDYEPKANEGRRQRLMGC